MAPVVATGGKELERSVHARPHQLPHAFVALQLLEEVRVLGQAGGVRGAAATGPAMSVGDGCTPIRAAASWASRSGRAGGAGSCHFRDFTAGPSWVGGREAGGGAGARRRRIPLPARSKAPDDGGGALLDPEAEAGHLGAEARGAVERHDGVLKLPLRKQRLALQMMGLGADGAGEGGGVEGGGGVLQGLVVLRGKEMAPPPRDERGSVPRPQSQRLGVCCNGLLVFAAAAVSGPLTLV
mmetsp:Transcript_14714/g.28294  ORF Transcript_14714/g.28294 Transcript_14714/m.28294 type:complete len:239 (+) Transcript_14714:1329-2045(+)